MASDYYRFATIARLAYLDNAKEEFTKLGYNDWRLIDIDGAQVHIAANAEEVVVAFRGTEPTEFNDIKADLRAFHHKGFHKGFYLEYKKVEAQVLDALSKLKRASPRPVYITGHSLGGAMATVAAWHLPTAKALYTFGSPRALGLKKAKQLKVPHYRVVNNNDIVPKVPPALLFFKHAGTLPYINYYGDIRRMSWWQRFKDGWRGRRQAWKKGVPFDGLYDHSMNEYCRFLEDGK